MFGAEVNEALLYEAVRQYTGGPALRHRTTKTRHEVSGSGKKLWKQKGTGRARMGSIRSPLWRHGGTVHGPQPRDYGYKLPRKMLLGALRSALSAKLRDGELKVVQAFNLRDHKTKSVAAGAGQARSEAHGAAGGNERDNRNLTLASRNLEGVKLVPSRNVNVYDLLAHKQVLLSEAGGAETLGGTGEMNVYEVIRRPLITEKGHDKREHERTLCFEVHAGREQDPDPAGGRDSCSR